MWILISIFVRAVDAPVELTQIGQLNDSLAACEAKLPQFLVGDQSQMGQDSQGLYVVTDYTLNSRQFRCFKIGI
jgi:hypothetical protein